MSSIYARALQSVVMSCGLLVAAALSAADWTSQDISASAGTTKPVGADGFNVSGAGANIWESSDSFRFVYQRVSGDFDVRARVVSVQITNEWAKAGLMVRQSAAPGSVHASVVAHAGGSVQPRQRPAADGPSVNSLKQALPTAFPNTWLRLVRSGSKITSYRAGDEKGADWKALGMVELPLKDPVLVGLCVCSNVPAQLCQAAFRNVSLSSGSSAPAENAAQPPTPDQQVPPAAQPSMGKQAGVVALTCQEPDSSVKGAETGVMARELVRQAILIAGRDGLGLPTRDMALREPFPAGNDAWPLDVKTMAVAGQFLGLTVSRGSGKDKQVLLRKDIPLAKIDWVDYVEVAEICEGLSRNEFVEMLGAAGFKGKANPNGDASVPSPETEKKLSQMSFFSTFEVLRDLHNVQRTKGESLATLTALARAYANLGLSTEHHWSNAHKVFKARALLYAQRALFRETTPTTLYVHAYVLCMMGMHAAALKDLESADKLTADQPASRPPWRRLIELDCRCDKAGLDALGKEGVPQSEQALLLSVMALGIPYMCEEVLACTRAVITARPDCFYAWDLYGNASGGFDFIGNDLGRSVEALQNTFDTLPRTMPVIPGAPQAVLTAFQNGQPGAAQSHTAMLALADTAQTDMAEPSWAMLGRLLQDTAFAQVLGVAHAWRQTLDRLPRKVAEDMSVIDGHPYKGLVDALLLPRRQQLAAFMRCVTSEKALTVSSSPTGLALFGQVAEDSKQTGFRRAGQYAARRADGLSRDLESAFRFACCIPGGNEVGLARKLYRVSPFNGEAVGQLLKSDNEFATKHAGEIEKTMAGSPPAMEGLAEFFHRVGMTDRAYKCLKVCVVKSPTHKSAIALAENIPADKQLLEDWVVVLDAYLAREKDNEHRYSVCHRCVYKLLQREEYEKAIHFGSVASKVLGLDVSGCHAHALEAAGRAAEAEPCYRRQWFAGVEKAPYTWFLWCARTGVGNIADARRRALGWADELETSGNGPRPAHPSRAPTPPEQELRVLAVFRQVNGENEKALACYRKGLERHADPWAGINACLLAVQLQKPEVRDEGLKQTLAKGMTFKDYDWSKSTVELAKLFQQGLAQNPPGALDLAAVDKLIQKADTFAARMEQNSVCYFVARFLDLHGNEAKAREYYQRAIDLNPKPWEGYQQTPELSYTLATIALRAKGAAPKTGQTPAPPPKRPDEF